MSDTKDKKISSNVSVVYYEHI